MSRVLTRNASNHAYHNRLGRAWLTNECNRVDRSGISIPVQRELMVAFSSPELGKWRELERNLSSEAKVVYDRFVGQMVEAKAEQRRGGKRSKLMRWWVDVQGNSGRRERREKMRKEGLLGAGVDNEGELEGIEENWDEYRDGEEVTDEDEDSDEQDSDRDDEIGDEARNMTPVSVSRKTPPEPVSREMTPEPVSREMTPVPIERGQR